MNKITILCLIALLISAAYSSPIETQASAKAAKSVSRLNKSAAGGAPGSAIASVAKAKSGLKKIANDGVAAVEAEGDNIAEEGVKSPAISDAAAEEDEQAVAEEKTADSKVDLKLGSTGGACKADVECKYNHVAFCEELT